MTSWSLNAITTKRKRFMALVKKEMEEVIALKVPLKVDIASGRNWDEAHG